MDFLNTQISEIEILESMFSENELTCDQVNDIYNLKQGIHCISS